MQNLLPYLAFLACPVGMGLMMWMMMRMGGSKQPSTSQQASMTPAQASEMAQLRAEVAQLRIDDRGATAWHEPR